MSEPDRRRWFRDEDHGLYWMREGDEERMVPLEFVQRDLEGAARLLGTTPDALRHAELRCVIQDDRLG
jgi:hypothetical protein